MLKILPAVAFAVLLVALLIRRTRYASEEDRAMCAKFEAFREEAREVIDQTNRFIASRAPVGVSSEGALPGEVLDVAPAIPILPVLSFAGTADAPSMPTALPALGISPDSFGEALDHRRELQDRALLVPLHESLEYGDFDSRQVDVEYHERYQYID